MKAGRMTERVELWRPTPKTGEFGTCSPEYALVAEVWAELKTQTGARRLENGELFTEYDTEFNLRAAHDVGDGWEVRHGGKRYTVNSVIVFRSIGMQTLKCNRIND